MHGTDYTDYTDYVIRTHWTDVDLGDMPHATADEVRDLTQLPDDVRPESVDWQRVAGYVRRMSTMRPDSRGAITQHSEDGTMYRYRVGQRVRVKETGRVGDVERVEDWRVVVTLYDDDDDSCSPLSVAYGIGDVETVRGRRGGL